MLGTRTLAIAAVVALVAVAASVGVAVLHVRAGGPRERYETFIALESAAGRLDALESQAGAERQVSLAVQGEFTALLDVIERGLDRLVATDARGGHALHDTFTHYRPLMEEQFEALRARDFAAAYAADEAVDFDALRAGLREAAAYSEDVADRAERLAWTGTIGVFVAAVIALTVLLAWLDRAGRRSARDAELQALAFTDSLTGLPNRTLFEQRIAEVLERGEDAVVAFLDLDDFKRVNDSLGHAAGDRLLEICGERLANALRTSDTVARLGGDEFAVLAVGADDPDALVDRLFNVLAAPVMLEGKRLHLRASIGIATTASGTDLLRNADLAMYAAKGSGTNRFAVFTADMHVHALARLDHREQLERAIENEELVLHFQPIVELDQGHAIGFEALVRWQHPVRGLLGPGEFIPLAEETGLIVPLGRWVLREACRQATTWPGAPYLSVNVAGAQLEQEGFVDEVAAALGDSGLASARLVLEVTESSLVGDAEAERLQALRKLGVRLAIDDFGTGYSSLSYLRRFPMDVLKIDRSFTRDACDDSALLRAIVAMGESLGLVLVPEGIESAEQAEALRALGCRVGQGYLFGRPVPAAELSAVTV